MFTKFSRQHTIKFFRNYGNQVISNYSTTIKQMLEQIETNQKEIIHELRCVDNTLWHISGHLDRDGNSYTQKSLSAEIKKNRLEITQIEQRVQNMELISKKRLEASTINDATDNKLLQLFAANRRKNF